MLLTNRSTLLISGATGFLGKSLAKHFIGMGFNLVLLGRDENRLLSLKTSLEMVNRDVSVHLVVCDLSSDYQLSEALKSLDDFPVDHYFSCVAIQGKPTISVSDLDLHELDLLMKVNLYSTISLSKYLVERWQDEAFHSIVLTSGGGAANSRSAFNSYSLSKTALVRFVENFSQMVDRDRIIINAVAPGVMPSELLKQIVEYPELQGTKEHEIATRALESDNPLSDDVKNLFELLIKKSSVYLSGRLISAQWDHWRHWQGKSSIFKDQDIYRLRRSVPEQNQSDTR